MKALYFLLILLSAACCSLSAQEAERIDTLTVNGNVYYVNYDLDSPFWDIYPGKNKIKLEECCGPRFDHESTDDIFRTVVKKTFNIERIRKLVENRHGVTIRPYCNTKGEILEVEFFLSGIKVSQEGDKHSISIKEIDMMNKELKKNKLNFSEACPDKKYYVIFWWFKLGRYLDD